MSADYAPGTVAMVTTNQADAPHPRRAIRVSGGWEVVAEDGSHAEFFWDKAQPERTAYAVTDVRPLVVLDPWVLDLREAVDFLRESGRFNGTARAIEEQIKPPKPAEPMGLGAVVEDSDGRRWVRVPGGPDDDSPWEDSPVIYGDRPYRRLDVVRVLSEGVFA